MYQHRHAIQKLGTEMQQYNHPRGTRLNANQLIKSKQARSSFVSLTAEIRWLLPKFEKFLPEYWFFGIVLLALRLVQTSFMAVIPSQYVQASVMLCATLVSISLQSEFSPYRLPSDNRVALLAQWLILAWVLVLTLRINGVFMRPVAATTIGVLLCVATMAVFVLALRLANLDRLVENRAEGSELNKAAIEVAAEESNNENDVTEPGEVEAGPLQGRESPADEEKAERKDTNLSSSLPWSSILSIGSGTLCGAETIDDTVAPAITGQPSFDELANLALAAGVDRSDISRLALALSKQLATTCHHEGAGRCQEWSAPR